MSEENLSMDALWQELKKIVQKHYGKMKSSDLFPMVSINHTPWPTLISPINAPIYFTTIRTNGYAHTWKMILIKNRLSQKSNPLDTDSNALTFYDLEESMESIQKRLSTLHFPQLKE